ncbi:hypothetical protein GCM10025876_34290 [Demequina litorisediminis]|uniref:Uncharacterized protein n=1 Tax=Demequina litorisediminis TaxID=1849022 RepID=A0ABQ6IH52_9MICO|nr:hypothetical protein GCM10025876_34290 [Demequina litorisediminis]
MRRLAGALVMSAIAERGARSASADVAGLIADSAATQASSVTDLAEQTVLALSRLAAQGPQAGCVL